VDNGLGTKYDDRFADIYAIDDDTNNLEGSLDALGFGLADVTDVILTHLHFDHCGGSTRRSGDALEIAFPHAAFHVQKGHWEWAVESNVREKASFLAENLQPLGASGQLNLIDGRHELFDGIELIPVDGHTREMQLVKVSDESDTLLYMADLVPTHAHIPSPWNMAYDLWPMTTIEEKGRLLEEAAREGWTLFFEHDHQIEIAGVEPHERGPRMVNPRSLAEF